MGATVPLWLLPPAALLAALLFLLMLRKPILIVALGVYAVSLDHLGRFADTTFTLNNLLKVVLVAVFLVWMLAAGRRLRVPRPLLWLLPFMLWVGLSTFRSPDLPGAAFFFLRLVFVWLTTVVAANVIETRRDLALILIVLVATAAVVSLLAHMQTLNVLTMLGVATFKKVGPDAPGVRAISTFWDSNQMGGFLAALSLFMVCLLGHRRLARAWKAAILVVLFITFGAILLSFSRSAWIALALGLVLLFRFDELRRQIAAYYLIGLLGVLYLALFTPYGHALWARVQSFTSLSTDFSGRFRYYLALTGLEIWSDGLNWLWGGGWASYGTLVWRHAYPAMTNEMIFHSGTHMSHTLYTTLLAEVGLVGLLLFALFLRAVFREIRLVMRRRPEGLFRLMLAASWAFLAVKLVDFFLSSNFFIHFFWLSIAIVCAIERMTAPPEAEPAAAPA